MQAYLPGLDDNFLADHIVIFPIMHVVHFDANQKIQSIRLSWDQGSLLKQVDVIGARARSWPIRDGKDQARLVASTAASAILSSGAAKPNGTAGKEQGAGRVRNNTNASHDPHASLALFSPEESLEPESARSRHGSMPPSRGNAGPPPR